MKLKNYLLLAGLSILLFTACNHNKKDKVTEPDKLSAAITATIILSSGKEVDFSFTPGKDDLIKPYVYGPNSNDHYKLMLRGEKEIDGFIYSLNLYATIPKSGVGSYDFGRAWQWYDEGPAFELLLGISNANDLMDLKQYMSMEAEHEAGTGLIISSFTDNHIKGSFSGTATYANPESITIKNGKIDIDFNRGPWDD